MRRKSVLRRYRLESDSVRDQRLRTMDTIAKLERVTADVRLATVELRTLVQVIARQLADHREEAT